MALVGFPDDGPRVLSVYEGFFSGGARVLHTAVVRSLDATTAQRHAVLGLTNRSVREGTVQTAEADLSHQRLRAAGVPVEALERETHEPLTPFHLAAVERAAAQADVVLSLKEQPLIALREVERPVVACLHRSDPEHSGAGLEQLVELTERGVVVAAVCCARSTQAAYHAATGIPLDQLPVIPNGTDLRRFRSSPQDRAEVRRDLGVVGDAPVVLLSARFDPMKDVGLFVRSAATFLRRYPDAHAVLCGAGMVATNPALADLLAAAGAPTDRVHLLGIRADMPRLYNGADLVAITSAYGEAAPLSLLEGMACGAVPVTTDVGDAALMVADPRLVIPDRDPDAVARVWEAAFEQREEHTERILRHRQRLSDQRCFDAYAALIRRLAAPQALEVAV
ncbi:glycosyltransferase [Nocardioides anomalus]|uniref:Glycosyltransferase n=1 Tax=Nocardioides anomalus TaxID=2712223 RepID=A0A6G6WF52_9ACTN|nr:glycosyltransferase [Nocardioides anomalus]QIG43670.1 glycosyltransferase [Nocardioides anomalus]